MKGYKALDKNVQAIHGDGMQFELGKLYSVKGEVVPCLNGYHFCKKIEQLNRFYNIANSRIFEIKVYGNIKKDYKNYVAKKIRLIRELTKEEINHYFKVNQQSLVNDADYNVRRATAEQGYGLDVLMYDKNFSVRCAVVRQGGGLDTFIHDDSCYIRCMVASQGYGLNILINDKNPYVRSTVALQGYGLTKLIHDESQMVRETVQEMMLRTE